MVDQTKRKEYPKWLYLIGTLAEWSIAPFFVLLFFLIIWGPARWMTYRRKKRREKPRIIWGPTPILTIPISSRAEKRRGYKSDTLVYQPYFLTNNFNFNLERISKYLWFNPLLSWFVFIWSVFRYDLFHFFFNRGFLIPYRKQGINRLELPLLQLAGKVVIISAYGGDVRYEKKCREGGKYNCCIDCKQKMMACICDEKLALANISYVNRYADLTLSMGDMMEYTPGSNNNVFYWPIDLDEVKYVGVRDRN